MNIIILKTKTGYAAVDERRQILAITKESILNKHPKQGEVWAATSRLFEALTLTHRLEDLAAPTIYGGYKVGNIEDPNHKSRLAKIQKQFNSILREVKKLNKLI